MIYLDAAAQEPLHPAAREAWDSTADLLGDPRRIHHSGRRVRLVLDQAREQVASALQARADEVIFTTSGTEAVHRGLLGLHKGQAGVGSPRSRPPVALICSPVEHSAVRHAGHWAAETLGASCVETGVDRLGRVDPGEVKAILNEVGAHHPRCVVAVQSANHEVGTVQPTAEIAEACGPHPLFVDACASMGRLPLPEGWAAAAGSAIKWGGPPGVGVLAVRKSARWRSPLPGDDRAEHRSVGFENVPAIAAAAASLAAVTADEELTRARQHRLSALLRERLARIPDSDIVGDPDNRLPHIVTASFLYVDGEALVTELDRAGFEVASGSACAASTLEPSAVLAAMGALTHGNVRISLTRQTTAADVVGLADAISDLVPRLRARVGL